MEIWWLSASKYGLIEYFVALLSARFASMTGRELSKNNQESVAIAIYIIIGLLFLIFLVIWLYRTGTNRGEHPFRIRPILASARIPMLGIGLFVALWLFLMATR